ncbi:MAG TPA: arylsulfotransferase family protein [Xanthomonadaceae bacterium]
MKIAVPFMLGLLLPLCAAAAPQLAQYGVTVNAGASVYPGNVLYSDCMNPNPDATGNVFLINQNGASVKQWHSTGNMMEWQAKPIGTDGSILTWRYASSTGNCENGTGKVWLTKIAGNDVATKIYNDPTCALNHDFEVLQDGTFLVLCRKFITDTTVSTKPFYDDLIRRVDGSGHVLWEWSTDAHYAQLGLSTAARHIIMAGQTVYPVFNPGDPPSSDVFHTNSIQFIPPNASAASNAAFTPGNILVDQRNTNLIFAIDYNTGNVVWQVGNISVGQHAVKMIGSNLPGDGHLLIFNNGSWGGYPAVVGFSSSVIEYDPIGAKVTWSYSAPYPAGKGFFSPYRGNAQRLPNGNTFIDDSVWGRIFEVDVNGNVVWEYVPVIGTNKQAANRSIYRAYKVELCWPGCFAESTTSDGAWTW